MLGYQFPRQKPLRNYIVDFFCPRRSLVIEIDGSTHKGKEREDKVRQDYLESIGLIVLRFGDGEVKRNTQGVVDRICQVLKYGREGDVNHPDLLKRGKDWQQINR